MSHTTDYKLTNVSGGPLGPIELHPIFGDNCDAEPQTVTLEDGEEFAFCGSGEDVATVQIKMQAALAALGSKLGYGGMILDQQAVIDPEPPPTDPPPPAYDPSQPIEPPDEAD